MIDIDPPEGDSEPMEVDLPPEEEPMEVNSLPSGQGRHYNIMLAQRRCHIHQRCARGCQFQSQDWIVTICQSPCTSCCSLTPFFPIPHPSPRPLTSSFSSSEKQGKTGMGLISFELLHRDNRKSPDSCDLLATSRQALRKREGLVWHPLSCCIQTSGGVQQTALSSLQPPGSVRETTEAVVPLEKQKTLVWIRRRAEVQHEGPFQLLH